MKRILSGSEWRPVLNWVLTRGSQLLTCQVEQAGDQYLVSALPQAAGKPIFLRRFDAGLEAFHTHAALVTDLRGHGWMLVEYR